MFIDAGMQISCRFSDINFRAGCTFDGVDASGGGDRGFSGVFNDVFDGSCGACSYVEAQILEVFLDSGKEGRLR